MKTRFTLMSGALLALAIVASPLTASAHSLALGGNAGLHLGSWIGLGADKSEHKEKEEKKNHKEEREDKDKDEAHTHFGIFGTLTAKATTTITVLAENGTTYTVDTSDVKTKRTPLQDMTLGDTVVVSGKVVGTSIVARQVVDVTKLKDRVRAQVEHTRTGVVTAVNGSAFTLDPFGFHATTTVTTNASTTYMFNGTATTSAALGAGSRVLVTGTSTATSTFMAGTVHIFTKMFGHLKHWF